MRRDAAILDDIVTSATKILQFCAGIDLAALMADELRQAAILHHLAIIGEAAAASLHNCATAMLGFRGRSSYRSAIAWSTSISSSIAS